MLAIKCADVGLIFANANEGSQNTDYFNDSATNSQKKQVPQQVVMRCSSIILLAHCEKNPSLPTDSHAYGSKKILHIEEHIDL